MLKYQTSLGHSTQTGTTFRMSDVRFQASNQYWLVLQRSQSTQNGATFDRISNRSTSHMCFHIFDVVRLHVAFAQRAFDQSPLSFFAWIGDSFSLVPVTVRLDMSYFGVHTSSRTFSLQDKRNHRFGSTIPVSVGVQTLALSVHPDHVQLAESERRLRTKMHRQTGHNRPVQIVAAYCNDRLLQCGKRCSTRRVDQKRCLFISICNFLNAIFSHRSVKSTYLPL